MLDGEIRISATVDSVSNEFLQSLAGIPEVVLAMEEEERAGQITVALVSDDELRTIHLEFLDDDSVTDVITFEYGTDWIDPALSGEILISVDRAREQAIEAGWSLVEELKFLLIHGMLHLCGWQDDTVESRAAMLGRQRAIMRTLQ